MADDGSFQERILKMLENIISNDRELRSFSIVPEEENAKNKSPVLYEDHHLALESWCVKHIYRYAYTDLLEVRHLLRKNRLSLFKAKELNHLLIGVLLINPDVTTFWAMKRELVESEVLSIENELLFSKLVLTFKSKSNETFSYRRWLLRKILDKTNDPEVLRLIYLSELIVVDIAAEKSPNNYHAWNHRIWCTENISSKIPHTVSVMMYNEELERSLRWIEQHVSENTGYHYRQYLIKLYRHAPISYYFENNLIEVINYLGLINDTEPCNFLTYLFGNPRNGVNIHKSNNWLNYLTLLIWELFITVEKLNTVFPEHESLWYHRRFLIYHLVDAFYEYTNIKKSIGTNIKNHSSSHVNNNIVNSNLDFSTSDNDNGEKQPKIFKSQPHEIESSRLGELLSKSEQKFISSNANSSYPMQREYAKRHATWLKLVIGFHRIY